MITRRRTITICKSESTGNDTSTIKKWHLRLQNQTAWSILRHLIELPLKEAQRRELELEGNAHIVIWFNWNLIKTSKLGEIAITRERKSSLSIGWKLASNVLSGYNKHGHVSRKKVPPLLFRIPGLVKSKYNRRYFEKRRRIYRTRNCIWLHITHTTRYNSDS